MSVVLPEGPAVLGHPTNEGLFAGPRFGRSLRNGYTGLGRMSGMGPRWLESDFHVDQRKDHPIRAKEVAWLHGGR